MTEELCGEPHPEYPDVLCDKPLPCYYFHASRQMGGLDWGECPAPPPKTSSVKGRVKMAEMAGRARKEQHVSVRVATTMAKEEGMAKALAATEDEFKEATLLSIRYLAERQEELTTDDVWADLRSHGFDTEHRFSMGSLIRQAARNGWVEKTDRMVSTEREDQRAHGLTVWRSLLFASVGTSPSG